MMAKGIILDEDLARRALEVIELLFHARVAAGLPLPDGTDHTLKELREVLGPHCYSCNSTRVVAVEGEFPTGVSAPDGGQEYRFQTGMRCLACGAVESD
jgi:hypothetical protein